MNCVIASFSLLRAGRRSIGVTALETIRSGMDGSPAEKRSHERFKYQKYKLIF
jgi:hypothetical protein